MANGHGGRRANSGTKKGTIFRKTLEKQLLREEVRKYIAAHIPKMIQAQIAHATGIGHLFTRDKSGRFSRIEDSKQIEKLLAEGVENRDYWIFAKDPSVQAFTDLMNRAIDKPAEHVELTGANEGPVEFRWKGEKG